MKFPDEAIDAASRAMKDLGDADNGESQWADFARAALEAAAPHMLAEAWREGEAAGQDNAYAYQIGMAVKSNPYRSAP